MYRFIYRQLVCTPSLYHNSATGYPTVMSSTQNSNNKLLHSPVSVDRKPFIAPIPLASLSPPPPPPPPPLPPLEPLRFLASKTPRCSGSNPKITASRSTGSSVDDDDDDDDDDNDDKTLATDASFPPLAYRSNTFRTNLRSTISALSTSFALASASRS